MSGSDADLCPWTEMTLAADIFPNQKFKDLTVDSAQLANSYQPNLMDNTDMPD